MKSEIKENLDYLFFSSIAKIFSLIFHKENSDMCTRNLKISNQNGTVKTKSLFYKHYTHTKKKNKKGITE